MGSCNLLVVAIIAVLEVYRGCLAECLSVCTPSVHFPGLRASSRLGSAQVERQEEPGLTFESMSQNPRCTLSDATTLTLMLDLDHTSLFGNDGNDLGVVLQMKDKRDSMLQQLYQKLVNPNLKKMFEAYKAQGKDIQVVIYTRRPSLLRQYHPQSRTSEVFLKTTRRVESDAELFANYGTKFRFAGVCVCHSCRPIEP